MHSLLREHVESQIKTRVPSMMMMMLLLHFSSKQDDISLETTCTLNSRQGRDQVPAVTKRTLSSLTGYIPECLMVSLPKEIYWSIEVTYLTPGSMTGASLLPLYPSESSSREIEHSSASKFPDLWLDRSFSGMHRGC
jgi:hypothetical protein